MEDNYQYDSMKLLEKTQSFNIIIGDKYLETHYDGYYGMSYTHALCHNIVSLMIFNVRNYKHFKVPIQGGGSGLIISSLWTNR